MNSPEPPDSLEQSQQLRIALTGISIASGVMALVVFFSAAASQNSLDRIVQGAIGGGFAVLCLYALRAMARSTNKE